MDAMQSTNLRKFAFNVLILIEFGAVTGLNIQATSK